METNIEHKIADLTQRMDLIENVTQRMEEIVSRHTMSIEGLRTDLMQRFDEIDRREARKMHKFTNQFETMKASIRRLQGDVFRNKGKGLYHE